MSFQQKIETIQYNEALVNLGAIRDSSREKLYQELVWRLFSNNVGIENLYKILKSQSPKCLYSIIPTHNVTHRKRECNEIPAINMKHDFFKNTSFPSTKIEWNKLYWKIKNSETIETFK